MSFRRKTFTRTIGVLVGRQPVCRRRIEVEVGHDTRPDHGVGEQCRMEIGGRYGVGQPTEVRRTGGRPDRGIGVGQQGAADFLRGLGPPLRELGAHRGVRIGGQAGPQIGRRPPVGRGGLTYLRGPVGDERLDQVPGEGRVTAGERTEASSPRTSLRFIPTGRSGLQPSAWVASP
ncbi:hypothetical protein ACIQK5_11510 [Streptomyces virginiae]|uniref:hypothetical protein n=1 Tax=Streptomyces virginiae TaxID=1961 RepID=UPI0037F7046F